MGRKRLTKECTSCRGQCERKQFSRSMWEREEINGAPVGERVCRQCHFEIKKSREHETLLLSAVNNANPSAAAAAPTSTVTTGNVIAQQQPALIHASAVQSSVASLAGKNGAMTQLDLHLLSESFLPSPMLASAGAAVQGPSTMHPSTSGLQPVAVARPRHNSTASQPLSLNLDDDEFDQELFEGVDLDRMFVGEGDEKEKRSARAKRRRAKMNALFSALASDVGLSVFSDRARVLERTRELIRELREAKEVREVKKLRMDSAPVAKPIVSILDVVSEHLMGAQNDIVTHSPCA